MKKLILFITTFLTLLSFTVTTYAETPKANQITPYSTATGNGGVSKIEIYDNRSRAWWYARPYTKSSYQFSGGVRITLTNGRTLYYPVSGKIKRVTFTGVAYGPGGIQIALPQSETNNYSSGGSGMSIPNPEILYEE
ncbi:hypothetical protein [Streptococcus sp. 79]|uniref:hypothetical protein n=1 Tax=Streptococcus sp. 79 TaxID=2582638 RepID=UPI0015624D0D|nr:hypothetical protein [Streptococcus sp. 79]